ncbi:glycosyl transferase group 1 [Gluconacetobacter diazotrophicus PA1 5]|uniref:Putative colanic acid biosynthesis glycosyl transferase n=1 Tax=Gluconacetobacter diazotrophicus (strain ATCC 49037 / DSM 5601 / CCUG 37298 / CIP 103539 / LMG 7603 / PAl5) TaxID=272568 RepID=A9HNQ7_GLUDA|nr:glycosyltransferase [Gluconacetobacter diazotrophicus]ACI50573.1 glycosyl transferase group 1 [Gluconacetobacter diazotrophicus PA1 5]TWB09405.1 glycosyltransferase involved in cell wall biosynthesis [Gluconacetobacter diazotrophicus]CAP56486.1 putative colanic acid biosynthesis glycosyl transferase [Gluconacetobacter diazotrophicus PA1 5]
MLQRTDSMTDRPTVGIYRTEILPLSETFVRDQSLALRRWNPVMIGERLVDRLPLEGLAAEAAYRGPATLPQRARSVVARTLDRAPPGLTRIARQVRPALIHAHFGFDGVEAWHLARRLSVPLLVTLHGSDITTHMAWFSAGRSGRRWKSYPSRLQKLARRPEVSFVAVSGHIRDAAIAVGLPAGRVHVRHIGIDPDRFVPRAPTPGARAPTILFLGRLVEKKGCRFLIEAFRRVRDRMPQARLVIAGDGPERAALQDMAAPLDTVTFTGAVSRDRVQDLLNQARIFCLPSVTAVSGDAEGLPLVLLEAQASGVPVVTSARGGVTEGIEDGETGFAFAERDIDALTDRLLALLADDGLADRMGAAGRRFVQRKHDIRLCTAALEDLYDELARIDA